MTAQDGTTLELLDRAAEGDVAARAELLTRHRGRLRQMVAVHLDRRVAARVDPSDVVQDALLDAAQELPEYLVRRPIPFYPWLRQLAWERLVELHRRHVQAKKRSVVREESLDLGLSGQSVQALAKRLLTRGESPSANLQKKELRARVRAALEAVDE